MYRKVEETYCELNQLRRENESLKKRLKKMQEVIRRYQIEKAKFMKEHGITRMGPKLEVDNNAILENQMDGI